MDNNNLFKKNEVKNMKCHKCNKEIIGDERIEAFDENEPTTIYLFCSETCKKKWTTGQRSKK